MKTYVVLYHAPQEVAARFAQATAEEAQAGLAQWQEWSAGLGDRLVDLGRPLGAAATVTAAGCVDGGSDVIGMSVVRAQSRDEALELVREHHHLAWGSITLLEEQVVPELA
ncbi:hypothetical protein [Microbacterium rhizosphaerae]|uniref:YCII-related domain-containing protein n=1 Tax=Microbacterium rhizosphaerae TaxID=1678237 RepID=A0ABZ0SR16_9MICO|nr:hypothetical protein [Microbacterium rhizosphaerae]WPR90122.1 hypothetical protein SM116_02215 [Microbacterium rhizosphaerae]